MTLVTWFQTNQSQILAALGLIYSLAVVVNGLLPYNSGERKWLSWLIDRVSPVVRQNSPGTWKLPIVASSQQPGPDGKLQELTPPKGFADPEVMAAIVAWCLFMGAALTLISTPGCAWFQHAKADVVECAEEEIQTLEKQVLGDVTQILLAGVAGWQAELASIASKVGEDVVGCIVEKLASGWTPPPGAAPALPPAAVRAYQYLNSQPKQFRL